MGRSLPLETGTKAIPVIVVASSNDVYLHLYDTVVKFLDSIRVGNRASFVQKDQADQQRQVGERGAQAYYQEQAIQPPAETPGNSSEKNGTRNNSIKRCCNNNVVRDSYIKRC